MVNSKWIGIWHFAIKDKDGNIVDQWDQKNSLADEGEENVLDQYFRSQNAPTTFYVRLYNDTPVDTDGLADLTNEPSGNGYSAQEIERSVVGWPTLVLDSGDFKITSKTVTFTASGGVIGPVTYAVLATTSNDTGKLILYVALSTTRTLADGESLEVTISGKLA